MKQNLWLLMSDLTALKHKAPNWRGFEKNHILRPGVYVDPVFDQH